MNLFIAGHGAQQPGEALPRRALTDLLSDWPFFDPASIESWSSRSGTVVMAAVAHDPAKLGGVRYSSFEDDRAALFAGRPVVISDGGRADGSGALDPARYHAPASQWADQLDGRFAVVRGDGATLEVVTDALGAYPVFEARAHGGRWFSNSAPALRLLTGDSAIDEGVLASLLAGGWSLGGDPVWRAVRRLQRGLVLTLNPEGEKRRHLLALEGIVGLFGAGLDVSGAAEDLVELTASLAQWPGRPNVVPVTGGRDSRLILAAALRAGFSFDAMTGGGPGDPDVETAAALCAITGLPHGLLEADPHGDRYSDLPRAALVTARSSGGTSTLADGAGFPLGPREGPMPLWHSGQGGEIARAYYGPGGQDPADKLFVKFTARRPGRPQIVSDDAARLVRGRIDDFVAEMLGAGASPADVPDLFYLLERMGGWAAATHGVVEVIRDTTSPLWSKQMLPHMLGAPVQLRTMESFHYSVLRELAPELMDPRFQDGSTWPLRQRALNRRVERSRVLAGKIRRELERRLAGRRARGPRGGHLVSEAGNGADPFGAVLADVADAAFSQPQHPAWSVLDRPRVEQLLSAPVVSLDDMSRYYVWRMASVFLA